MSVSLLFSPLPSLPGPRTGWIRNFLSRSLLLKLQNWRGNSTQCKHYFLLWPKAHYLIQISHSKYSYTIITKGILHHPTLLQRTILYDQPCNLDFHNLVEWGKGVLYRDWKMYKRRSCKFFPSLGKICAKSYAVLLRKWVMLQFCTFWHNAHVIWFGKI